MLYLRRWQLEPRYLKLEADRKYATTDELAQLTGGKILDYYKECETRIKNIKEDGNIINQTQHGL